MTRLALGRGNRHTIVAKDAGNSLSLTAVANLGGSGVSIDIANLADVDATLLQTELQRAGRTLYVRRRDMVAIARETPADNLGQNRSTALHSTLVALDHQGSSTTARNKTIALAIERTASLRGVIVITQGKRLDAIE